MEARIFTQNRESEGVHNRTWSRGEQLMSLHDSRLVSPTESLVPGGAEARKRCTVCSNTFRDAACQSQKGKGGN